MHLEAPHLIVIKHVEPAITGKGPQKFFKQPAAKPIITVISGTSLYDAGMIRLSIVRPPVETVVKAGSHYERLFQR